MFIPELSDRTRPARRYSRDRYTGSWVPLARGLSASPSPGRNRFGRRAQLGDGLADVLALDEFGASGLSDRLSTPDDVGLAEGGWGWREPDQQLDAHPIGVLEVDRPLVATVGRPAHVDALGA